MGNKELVPELRFPQFRDDPAWSERPLEELLREHGEKSDGESLVHSVSVHKGVIDQVEHLGRSFAAADTARYNLVKPGDVIYTKSPTGDFPYGIVKQNKLDYPVIVSPLYGVFSPENKFVGYMVDAYFESAVRANNYLAPITQKGAKNTIQISNSTFLSKGLFIPSNQSEQKKIADCLMSVDEMIALESQKLTALQTYKKGLLQNLFPRPERIDETGKKIPAETTPRFRFPEFQNAKLWEAFLLKEVCVRIMDGTHFSPKSKGGPRPYITSKNIRNGHLDISNLSTISEEEHRTIYSRCPVQKGDVLLTKDGANTGNCTLNNLDMEFSLLSSVAVLQGKGEMVDQRFLFQSVVGDYFQKQLKDSMSGQAITRITLEKLGNYKLRLPDVNEQRKIADFLADIDNVTNAQIRRLDHLKAHKQGLMQSLFPRTESA